VEELLLIRECEPYHCALRKDSLAVFLALISLLVVVEARLLREVTEFPAQRQATEAQVD
jgi:hypothetical protein